VELDFDDKALKFVDELFEEENNEEVWNDVEEEDLRIFGGDCILGKNTCLLPVWNNDGGD
jgi:hypothetical protein